MQAVHERSDGELIRAVRAGDMDAYGILWTRYADAAQQCARVVARVADPDDMVAEAFTATLQAIVRGGGPDDRFRAYVLTVIRNLAAKQWKGAPLASLDEMDDWQMPPAFDDGFEETDTRVVLQAAFQELPPRHRDLLWLMEVEGLKTREVSELMGITPNAVSNVVARARANLKRALSTPGKAA
ncbi:RNA polymerase sigma factor [Microbacterium gorillae]|uniref:RNA polymerase sigma factor n=1 Tax=Microbacterium gorillae TaxID=1231063 RepID=UPI003D9718E4